MVSVRADMSDKVGGSDGTDVLVDTSANAAASDVNVMSLSSRDVVVS